MIEDIYHRYGEYHNVEAPRSPRELHDLRTHNREQDLRIGRIEVIVAEIRTGLYGPDGQNGLRGELRAYQRSTNTELAAINAKLDDLVPRMWRAIGGTIAALAGLAAVAGVIVERMV